MLRLHIADIRLTAKTKLPVPTRRARFVWQSQTCIIWTLVKHSINQLISSFFTLIHNGVVCMRFAKFQFSHVRQIFVVNSRITSLNLVEIHLSKTDEL